MFDYMHVCLFFILLYYVGIHIDKLFCTLHSGASRILKIPAHLKERRSKMPSFTG